MLLEIATNVPNPWMRGPTLSWHHTAVASRDKYERAQLDGNDAKRELARSHKNPAQGLNEDSEVKLCTWMYRVPRIWIQPNGCHG